MKETITINFTPEEIKLLKTSIYANMLILEERIEDLKEKHVTDHVKNEIRNNAERYQKLDALLDKLYFISKGEQHEPPKL